MATVARTSLSAEIRRTADLGHLEASHLAAVTGGDLSSARRWLRGVQVPTGRHAERVLELGALVERLTRVMDAEYVPIWLVKPIERLGDRRPVDCVRAGRFREVSRVVAALEGMPVA